MTQSFLPKTVTIQDIAERLGISKNSVSLALRNSPRISEKTKTQVHDLAQKLNYVPNLAARNLTNCRSGLIGIYTLTLNDFVRMELVNSLIAELHFAYYRPILGLGEEHYGGWQTSPWIKTFEQLNIEALVVINEVSITKILPIPTICVACHPNDSLKCDYIALDRTEAAHKGLSYLIKQGYKSILIGSPRSSPIGKACKKILSDAGIEPKFLPVQDFMLDEEIQNIANLSYNIVRQENTAILFSDSYIAARVCHTLTKMGVHIPSDVSIIGYDYFPWAHMLSIPLTTIEQPIADLALRAIELTKQRLLDPDAPFRHEVLSHKLVIRQSTV